eukprot:1898581-Pyramimonas_sp.AAC.1
MAERRWKGREVGVVKGVVLSLSCRARKVGCGLFWAGHYWKTHREERSLVYAGVFGGGLKPSDVFLGSYFAYPAEKVLPLGPSRFSLPLHFFSHFDPGLVPTTGRTYIHVHVSCTLGFNRPQIPNVSLPC